MEKIFKKSLALILSAALCLTALVGCLTVSAAEGDTTKPVYSVNSVEGAAGAEVDVVASFSKISNVCAHHVIFTFPAGLEVTAVKNAAGEPYAAFDNSGARFDYKLDVAEDGTTKVQFLDFVNWAEDGLSTTDMSIHFTVKIAVDAAANTEYTVTIAVQAADQEAVDLLDVTTENGKVTVKAATTEPVLDETIKITTAINISETINARIMVSKEIAAYANYDLVVSRKKAFYISAAAGYGLTEVQDFTYGKSLATILNDGRGVFLYNELGMYELGIDFDIKVKCYDESGKYVAYSKTETTNIGRLAYGLYSPANASAKNKNIAIDIAKLGDKAQAYMVNGIDCALATVASPLSYFPEGATEGAVFDESKLNTTNIPTNDVEGMNLTAAVNLSANPALRFLSSSASAYDESSIRITVDYINGKNGNDCGVNFETSDILKVGSGNNVRYGALFNKIALYDSNVPVKATIYSGATKLASVEYSIEAYVKANQNHARMGDVLKAVANLGTSARAYFNM